MNSVCKSRQNNAAQQLIKTCKKKRTEYNRNNHLYGCIYIPFCGFIAQSGLDFQDKVFRFPPSFLRFSKMQSTASPTFRNRKSRKSVLIPLRLCTENVMLLPEKRKGHHYPMPHLIYLLTARMVSSTPSVYLPCAMSLSLKLKSESRIR